MELTTQYAQLLEKVKNKKATEAELQEFLEKAEKEYAKEEGTVVSFNHPLEAFYYEYYISKNPYVEAPVNMGLLYRTLGRLQMESRKMRKAEASLHRSYRWNPTDLDTLYELIEYHKKGEELDRVYSLTEKCYPFCCTRADLAHYYRNLGFYYLESYEPELAVALYEYSQLFYETKQAENELAYLKQAMGERYHKVSSQEIVKLLEENEIPVEAARETVGIAYQVGASALKAGNRAFAADCLMMVYDVTQDEEVKAVLAAIQMENGR